MSKSKPKPKLKPKPRGTQYATLNDTYELGLLFIETRTRVTVYCASPMQWPLNAADLQELKAALPKLNPTALNNIGTHRFHALFPSSCSSQHALTAGLVCHFGLFGTARDERKAVHYYRAASERGSTVARNNLFMCMYWGDGCVVDRRNALKGWAELAKGSNQTGALLAQVRFCLRLCACVACVRILLIFRVLHSE